jgi:lysophospholipid acyltransferase (LPLAT)-like uncharacterized protein
VKIRHPFWIRLAAFIAAWVVRIWVSTLGLRKIIVDGMPHPVDPKKQRFIFAAWHDTVFSMASIKIPADVLISRHADGELIAQACGFLGIGVVRGSTTRGGAEALLELARSTRPRHMLITPDGPRGPRHQLQPGIAALASRTGLPIVLIAIAYVRPWRLSSWDRTVVPRPWSLARVLVSESIHVPPLSSRADLELYRSRIERRFLDLTELAECWAESGRRPALTELAPVSEFRRKCA